MATTTWGAVALHCSPLSSTATTADRDAAHAEFHQEVRILSEHKDRILYAMDNNDRAAAIVEFGLTLVSIFSSFVPPFVETFLFRTGSVCFIPT